MIALVLGLDIITPESVFGYESDPAPMFPLESNYATERVVIPDTSQFLQATPNVPPSQGPLVAFPKYNNYLQDRSKFDARSKMLLPLKLLGIRPLDLGELTTKHSLSESKAVLSYVQYRQAGLLFPTLYDDSVVRRWGVDVTIGSPLISVSVLVPELVESQRPKPLEPPKLVFETLQGDEADKMRLLKKTLTEPEVRISENDAQYYRVEGHRMKRDQSSTKKLLYKSLVGEPLTLPVRLQIWMDSNLTIFNERSNPQCVHWSTARGYVKLVFF